MTTLCHWGLDAADSGDEGAGPVEQQPAETRRPKSSRSCLNFTRIWFGEANTPGKKFLSGRQFAV